MKIRNKIKKINETLFEMILGIVAWGFFWQVTGVWFVPQKLNCSIGLWIGIVLALCGVVHMYISLDRALSLDEKGAQKQMVAHNLIRYIIFTVSLGILAVTEIGNPLTGFLGIMGIKAAAFVQPFTHKLINNRRR